MGSTNAKILKGKTGEKLFLLGNEAIARGAVEAGVTVAATYPGTPSSEIGNVLSRIAEEAGMYFEFSANEKVAMEVAMSGAMAGHRSLAFMKHVGLNVASDAFIVSLYGGGGATEDSGMVIVVADDPSCFSSQSEQDTRYFSRLADVPTLEPSNPAEAKEMVKEGYKISEKLELPVLVRTTTRVSHVRGPVPLGRIEERDPQGKFEKDFERYMHLPPQARKQHKELLRKMSGPARNISEKTEFNEVRKVEGGEEINAIASGPAFNYLEDVMMEESIPGRILKLGMTHPLPEDKIKSFLDDSDQVLVVEELEPILETKIREIAKFRKKGAEILGKRQEFFSRYFEFTPDTVRKALSKILGRELEVEPPESELELPSRSSALCPGCPHRGTYLAVKRAMKKIDKNVVYTSDIGCYTLGAAPPFEAADAMACMGSSIGLGSGLAQSTDQQIVSFIGDSTFFHSGIPGLINAVHQRSNLVLVVLDNRTTAMTGHQPNPGVPIDGMGRKAPEVNIESVAKGCGVKFARTVSPFEDLERVEETIEEAAKHDGPAVVISKDPCILRENRRKRKAGEKIDIYEVDQDKCINCDICIDSLSCPAFYLEDESVKINPDLCEGCGLCSQICPVEGAIKKVDK